MDRPDPLILTLCRALPADGSPLPEWLPLIPAGDSTGRDGRGFRNPDPAAVVAAFDPTAQLPLDYEHSTHVRAPQGQDAPAVGWIVALEEREGAVWGQFDWNPTGVEAIRTRAYRYYSPAVQLDASGAVVRLLSVGLTNTPNLSLPALNRQAPTSQEPSMDPDILVALGLPAGATPAQAVTVIAELKTSLHRAQTPDLSQFAPRADLDAALHRAQTAEQTLAETQQAERTRQIDALIQDGLSRARIAPATVDYHRAAAATEGGLDRLRAYLDTAPALLDQTHSKAGAPVPEGALSLNADEARIAAAFGNAPDILAQYGVAK
jgi:phage I-like protein